MFEIMLKIVIPIDVHHFDDRLERLERSFGTFQAFQEDLSRV